MTRYAIGLGSNLGDRIGHLRFAYERIQDLGTISDVGGLYETAPVGGPDQGPYLNSLVVLTSDLAATDLLAELNRIEADAGRERTTKWGPRTLDLDIISMESGSIKEQDLSIPHLRAGEREFVLRPLCDVWPEAVVGAELTASKALESVQPQGVDLLSRVWLVDNPWPGRGFVATQFAWFIAIALAMASDGTLPEGDIDPLRIVGLILAIIGGALAFVSSRRLGPFLTAVPEPAAESKLVETSTYRLVRHPIYGGVVLFILGASLIVDSLIGSLLSLGLIPFFVVKSSYEERRLRIRFADYSEYRSRVPRRMIPFLI